MRRQRQRRSCIGSPARSASGAQARRRRRRQHAACGGRPRRHWRGRLTRGAPSGSGAAHGAAAIDAYKGRLLGTSNTAIRNITTQDSDVRLGTVLSSAWALSCQVRPMPGRTPVCLHSLPNALRCCDDASSAAARCAWQAARQDAQSRPGTAHGDAAIDACKGGSLATALQCRQRSDRCEGDAQSGWVAGGRAGQTWRGA